MPADRQPSIALDHFDERLSPGRVGLLLALGVGVLSAMYVTSTRNYPLFHTVVELASIVVACGVFLIVWNTRRFVQNGYLLFLGVAWLFVAVIDLAHTMAYKDVHIIGEPTADPATQAWIAARYMEGVSLVIAPLFLRRRPRMALLLWSYAAVTAGLLAAIFYWDIFPPCFVEVDGVGRLTPFKIASEYIVCLMFVAAAALLWVNRHRFDRNVLRFLIAAIAVKTGSELAFTLYVDAFGLANFFGHILKAVATYLIYKAIIEASLEKPYSLLFREIHESRDALRQSAERLERQIVELETARRQTFEAKAAAEDANMAKSQFLASMSHELRTPMSAILGMTELAIDEQPSPAVLDCLQTVKDSADSLLELLNEILDLSRIEAGGVLLESSPFGLRELIDKTLKVFALRAREKGLSLFYEVRDDVPDRLLGDPLRLRQVITNLVGNALKFTTAGHVSVRVRLVETKDEHVCLLFSVADTGMGIPPEHLGRIFAPFVQADASTARHFGGTGLGLAICQRLVELMDGGISVDSRLGAGSTFRFTVWMGLAGASAAEAFDDTPNVAARTGNGAAAMPVGGTARPLNVLLAEDTAANRKIITRILEKHGHRVEGAANGQEAIDRLLHAEFDVVLMDVQMPGLDGFEATAAIRQLPDTRKARVPIIAMTAHALKGDRERCLTAGMDAYIAKPVRADELIGLVQQWGAGPTADQAAGPPTHTS
jgi:signal transduction histidine kinase/ActR/RegA family two-component response regulator